MFVGNVCWHAANSNFHTSGYIRSPVKPPVNRPACLWFYLPYGKNVHSFNFCLTHTEAFFTNVKILDLSWRLKEIYINYI